MKPKIRKPKSLGWMFVSGLTPNHVYLGGMCFSVKELRFIVKWLQSAIKYLEEQKK